MSERPQSWTRYLREVTRFDQFRLLELVAEASYDHLNRTNAAADTGRQWHPSNSLHPFAMSRVARDVILDGFATATTVPRMADLERLCSRYIQLDDPITQSSSRYGGVANFMVRMAYEQFPYQLSPHNELCRSWALFADTAAIVGAQSMTEAAWRLALGCGLDEYLRIAFVWQTVVSANRGWAEPEALRHPGALPFLGGMSADDVWRITTGRLAGDLRQLREDPGNARVPKGLEKHRYNPLVARPYVRRGDRLLAPSPQLAVQRAWPNSIYYDRVKDEGFTDDLGMVFETYVGRQLALLREAGIADVVPKVVYDRGMGEEESVDHFVIFPEVVVLVEAKATRLTVEARLGTDRLRTDVDRTLGIAYSQLGVTSELIRAGREEFVHLPADRPMLGLAVTLEPYWLMWGQTQLPPMPTTIAALPVSCSDIEGFVSAALAGPVGDVLVGLTRTVTPVGRDFNTAFAGRSLVGNPILDAAFENLFGR